MIVPIEVFELIEKGALFVINDSAGKDSQTMKINLLKIIPKNQLVIVHADLGEVEWSGNVDLIKKYSGGVEVHVVKSNKTFFDMVNHREKFPSPSQRQCTSDLKRAPIQKFINNYTKEKGFKYVVNCMGLRAEESPARSKKIPFQFKENLSAKHRHQFEWFPILDYNIDRVWETIKLAGQKPHYAYEQGMSRLSCCFCIMASDKDLKTAAKLNPELAEKYMQTEEKLNFTMSMSRRFLRDIVRDKI